MPQTPAARQTGLVLQEMPDELLVYDLRNDRAHCLNSTAARIWGLCDGNRTAAQIAAELSKADSTTVSEDLIWLAIDQLNENGLLVDKTDSKFKGVSRRDVLKKIGLASVIALPIVASLAAPQSVLAVASCACGGPLNCTSQPGCMAPCQSNGQCSADPFTSR